MRLTTNKYFPADKLHPATVQDVYAKVRSLPFRYTRHAEFQKKQRDVADWEYIAEHGKFRNIIYDSRGRRVMFETPDGHCAVFALTGKRVVTMWRNS